MEYSSSSLGNLGKNLKPISFEEKSEESTSSTFLEKMEHMEKIEKNIDFKKEQLIEELLLLGNAKITEPVARLISTAVENQILHKNQEYITAELVSELVEEQLVELGLIRRRPVLTPLPSLSEEAQYTQQQKPEAQKNENNFIKDFTKDFTIVKTKNEADSDDFLQPEVIELFDPRPTLENNFIIKKPELKEVAAKTRKNPLFFSEKAVTIFQKHFLQKNEKGAITETIEEALTRIAKGIASAEVKYSPQADVVALEAKFYNLMANQQFFPLAPVLKKAGRSMVNLASCITLTVNDSMEDIFQTMKEAAVIQKAGSGTGISFSSLRPRHDPVATGFHHSTGPVSFMKVYASAIEAVREGGVASGETVSLLDISHPDVLDYLQFGSHAKTQLFRLCLSISSDFIRAVEMDTLYALVNPRTGEPVRRIKARKLLEQIGRSLRDHGEIDIIFRDRFLHQHPFTPARDPLVVDPCTGQPAESHQACFGGVINLSAFAADQKIDWEHLKAVVHDSVHFLDNTIEISKAPLGEIDEVTRRTRKITLGVMGWAELLVKLQIPYDSHEAEALAMHVMGFINNEAQNYSMTLAENRGVFSDYGRSHFADKGLRRRHGLLTGVFSSSLLADLAGVSPGISPIPELVSLLHHEQGGVLSVHPLLDLALRQKNIPVSDLLSAMVDQKGLKRIEQIPFEIRRLFPVEDEVTAEWLLKIQSAFQKGCEGRVSLPILLNEHHDDEDAGRLLVMAYHQGAWGIRFKRPDGLNNVHWLEQDEKPDTTLEQEITLKPRPDVLKGITRKMTSACGPLFVTLNEGNGDLFEMSTELDQEEPACQATLLNALSRMVSLSLRAGLSSELIADTLSGLACHEHKPEGDVKNLSYADAIAVALNGKNGK